MTDRGEDKSLQLPVAESVPSSQQADAGLPQQYKQAAAHALGCDEKSST